MATFNRIEFTSGRTGLGYQVVREGWVIDTTDDDGASVVGQVYESRFVEADVTPPAFAGNYADPSPPDPSPDSPPTGRFITVYAFRARFTTEEKVAIEIAALGNAALPADHQVNLFAARLRASEKDLQAARRVDLDLAETREGVGALEAVGILASGRAAAILDGEVTEDERA